MNDGEPAVLNPSKAKFDKFLEDIRQREAASISGTFGEGPASFNFGTFFKVDENCEIKNVQVMHDLSCVLVLEDIAYNQLSQIKLYKM
jgi:hypothetical protein